MGFAFFKSFSIRGDSEHIPGFLAGCCIKYLTEKARALLRGTKPGGALHKVCAFTVVTILPVCYISYPSLVPMSQYWTCSCSVKILANTTEHHPPHYRGFFTLPFRACSHLGALFNPPTFKRTLVKPRPCHLSPSFLIT